MEVQKVEPGDRPDLIDCGQASKVTKGSQWWFPAEAGPPPFDRVFT